MYPLLVVLIAGLLMHFKQLMQVKFVGMFLLALAPMFIQLTVFKQKFNSYQISRIDSYTFRNYLLAQTVAKTEGISLDDSRKTVKEWTDLQARSFVMEHSQSMAGNYFDNLWQNMSARANFFFYPEGMESPGLGNTMNVINKIVSLFHLLFFFPVIVLILKLRNTEPGTVILLLSGYLSFLYILLTSGISFWEGDRLVITTWAIWPVLYTYTAYRLLSGNKALPQPKES
jgi:hypothetical protein